MQKLFLQLSKVITLSIIFLATPSLVSASETTSSGEVGHAAGITFLFLGILILSAKIGSAVERWGQPAVLGELAAGIFLSVLAFLGLGIIDDIRHNSIMAFFAELGAVILLFQIGLESTVAKMIKVGKNAFLVALIGVFFPFVTGSFIIGPLLFPELSFISHLFLGASLVATSVGITAYVFQELRMLTTRACQTVLGAAVIDDILGLVILAVVSALASGGTVDAQFLVVLFAKAFGFLLLAVLLGNILAKSLSKVFTRINTRVGMKLALALTFALAYAYIASLVGLAPIVGAFAAGLILDPVHFRNFDLSPIAISLQRLRGFNKEEKEKIDNLIERHQHHHIEDLIGSIGLMIIPIFFVYTGLQIDFASLLNPQLYIYAFIISVVAILGKVIAGIAASGSFKEKLLVGVSMVPRGEVGLIFAAAGKSSGAINNDLFSIIILVIIITTFISPPLIKLMLSKVKLSS